MRSAATLERVSLLKHNAICEAPQCRAPAAYRLDFTGAETPGLSDLALCVNHARETCKRFGYVWH